MATRSHSAGRPPIKRWVKLAFVAGMWFVVVFLAVGFVKRDALKYLDWSEAMYQRFWPHRSLLAIHVTGASIALVAGPLQFSKTLRRRLPKVHRVTGWLYVGAVMVSTPFAVRLSIYSGCPLCVSPFVIWGTVTLIVTAIAVVMAVLGNYKAHRDFMVRSYVMMYAFVLVRLDAHLVGTSSEVPLPAGVERNSMVIWLSWVVPLLLAEFFLSWLPTVQRVLRRESGAKRVPGT